MMINVQAVTGIGLKPGAVVHFRSQRTQELVTLWCDRNRTVRETNPIVANSRGQLREAWYCDDEPIWADIAPEHML